MENKKRKVQNEEVIQGSTRIRTVRFLYGGLAAVYFICVILQVFFAGLGLFVNSSDWQLHRVFANYFEAIALLLFLLSFFGRIRGGLRWLPLSLFVLTSLQHMTIQTFSGYLRALHTIDALLLFGISMHLMKRSWRWVKMGKN
ncbi:hypothetical protein IEC97_17545 [Neobacillus cucumis]|uniref:DUF6220 domain-containing protein n=1 Tax=Neobacillus cucumis TaxID=1740721 RepID=UPI0018DF53BE|nr:DUF6220 domain-containing protein [Neobacillus cucumis]MBI0579178.1 hypothetical protein [Neobacillus cucumis]